MQFSLTLLASLVLLYVLTMSHRIAQINELIRHELGSVLLTEMDFPKGALVTITNVETSKDLRHTKIWFSVLPAYFTPKILERLTKRKGSLEYALYQRLSMKPLPKLSFRVDDSERQAAEIDALLDSIKETE